MGRAVTIQTAIATLGPVGFLPRAPGTWGTLAAVPVVWLIDLPFYFYVAATIAVCALGTYAAGAVEQAHGVHDPGYVIIDEFAGFMIAAALLPKTLPYMAAAFVLFRVFDILKPPPIKQSQKLRGGLGVMADDMLAGLATNLLIQAWMRAPWN